jgi:acyl-CoA oxidase
VLEQRLVVLVRQHLEDTEAGKDTSHACHALTMAHGDFVYWQGFWEVIDTIESDKSYKTSMVALAQLVRFFLHGLLRDTPLTTYVQFSLSIITSAHTVLCPPLTLTATQRSSLRSAYDQIIVEVAERHASIIVDSYGFTEFELDSALARHDQTPYEALLEGARKSEMNHMQHLWPMMVDTRRIWKQVQQEKEGAKARL